MATPSGSGKRCLLRMWCCQNSCLLIMELNELWASTSTWLVCIRICRFLRTHTMESNATELIKDDEQSFLVWICYRAVF
jgi:hypothetical protein